MTPLRRAYERWLLPPLLDLACGLPALHRERAAVVARAQGRVLEVGIGSGLNLAHYRVAQVQRIDGLDPSAELSRKARRRAEQRQLPLQLLQLGAERIPAADDHYDSLVCTFTLCTIPEPGLALAEMYRVLKPGGLLLFCEHGLAPDAPVARWQRRLNPCWSPCAGGCRLDRDGPALLRAAGFALEELQQHYLPGPRPWTYVSRGVARKPQR